MRRCAYLCGARVPPHAHRRRRRARRVGSRLSSSSSRWPGRVKCSWRRGLKSIWMTRTWTIPGARMKSDARAHSVPLAPRVLEILHRAKGLSDGGPYVFPVGRRRRPLWNMVLLILLRRLQRGPPHGARVPQHVSGLGMTERTNPARARGLRSRPGPHAPGQGRSGLQPDRPVRAPPRADDDMGGLCHGTGG